MQILLRALVFIGLFYSRIGNSQTNKWTFGRCIEQCFDANLSIKKSVLNKVRAQYDLELNKAQYLPTLNARYTNGFNWGRSIDPTSYQYVNGLVHTNNLAVMGSITLFDGLTTQNRIKQSFVGIDLTEAKIQQQKNVIAITVGSLYLQTLIAYEQVDIISTQLKASRLLLTTTEKKVQQGLKPNSEVSMVKSQIAQEQTDSIRFQNTLILSKLSLMQLMEMPYTNDFEIERFNSREAISSQPLSSTSLIFNSAISKLPEINNAELSIMSNEIELKAIKASYYPSLTLNGNLGTNFASSSKIITQEVSVNQSEIGYLSTDPSQTVTGLTTTVLPVKNDYPYFDQLHDNLNPSLNLVLSIPIYNQNQVKINAQKAKVNIDAADIELQNQKNLLRKDIETEFLEYTLIKNQLRASIEKLKAYKESYSRINKQYELQLSNGYELMLEKNKISQAESEVIQLEYQKIFKIMILRYYETGIVDLQIQ